MSGGFQPGCFVEGPQGARVVLYLAVGVDSSGGAWKCQYPLPKMCQSSITCLVGVLQNIVFIDIQRERAPRAREQAAARI